MGAIARIADSNILLGAARLVLPSTLATGAEFVHILTGTGSQATRNWVPGKANGTLVGTPTPGAGYLEFEATSSYINTSLVEPETGTYLTVSRMTSSGATSAEQPMMISTYVSGSGQNVGVSIYHPSATQARINAATYNTSALTYSQAVANVTSTPTDWRCLIGTFTTTGISLYDRTAALTTTTAITAPNTRAPSLGNVVRIGSSYSFNFGGTSDQILAMAWSRVLSSDERDAAYEWAQAVALAVSVTV